MPESTAANPDSAAILLLSQSFGPTQGGRMQVWHWLSSFQNWPELISELREIEQLDEGDPGRGSRFSLHWDNGWETCKVTHWHPGQKLILQYDDGTGHRAYQVSIASSSDPHTYLLNLHFQARYKGLWRFFAPILKPFEIERAKRRFGALLNGLSRLQKQM